MANDLRVLLNAVQQDDKKTLKMHNMWRFGFRLKKLKIYLNNKAMKLLIEI